MKKKNTPRQTCLPTGRRGVPAIFFEYVFPDVFIEVARFLNRDDAKMFWKEDIRGTYLPWNTDKSLTLLKDE